jgi:hypothetical protein
MVQLIWDRPWTINRGKKDIQKLKTIVGVSHWIPDILCHLKLAFFID